MTVNLAGAAGNAGFGGAGGAGGFGGAGGGALGGGTYGDLAKALEGGSGGGGGFLGGGGGGGGALELAALGTITVGGTLSAVGGAAFDGSFGGGGSGGGLFLAAESLVIDGGSLTVAGGAGAGGGGGGGRILIETGPGGLLASSADPLDIAGGAGGNPGGAGVLTILPFPTDPVGPHPVPEPSSVALLGLGAVGLGLLARRRRAPIFGSD